MDIFRFHSCTITRPPSSQTATVAPRCFPGLTFPDFDLAPKRNEEFYITLHYNLLPELKFSPNGRTDLKLWSYSITHYSCTRIRLRRRLTRRLTRALLRRMLQNNSKSN